VSHWRQVLQQLFKNVLLPYFADKETEAQSGPQLSGLGLKPEQPDSGALE
jgi:hypothetical protein